ncbi:hypothetical protein M9Y10_026052 [Tritrichomonas musculus]|uniref:Uncharacterized protein n=1 Tax=Tritrichomonas musculus TaxID=1915356 RepID=A0ABR2HAP5_9EUKA
MFERLPQNYVPTHYDLYIHFKKREYPFSASVTITFHKNQNDDKVFLHFNSNIAIINVIQNGHPLKFTMDLPKLIIYRSEDPEQDISTYPITIEYQVIPLFRTTNGFYGYEDCYFTNFEPNYARTLLPCFDEPCNRSSFKVRIRIPSDLNGVSNMPIQTIKLTEEEKEITFLETPAMCSYLLCICVGNFQAIEDRTKNGLPVKIYASKDIEKYGLYLTMAIYSIEWMEEKMSIKYELPHLQFISHDGIGIGMENYGLIALKNCFGRDFLFNTLTIMHEIAHLWFGDLVSIKWWDSIWLNEGFAQYFEYLILRDCLNKSHDYSMDLFTKHDGLNCLAFFDNSKIYENENEMDYSKELLRAVHYIKGAFVLRMFSNIVGEENFLKVCSTWLSTYQHKSAEIPDFIQIVNDSLGNDFTSFFDIWLKEDGLPLLNVVEMYDEHDEVVGIIITQCSISEKVYQFKLPIVYEKNGEMNKFDVMIKDEETVVDADFDWILVNDGMASLCAVIYSQFLLEKLVDAKNDKKISYINSCLIAKSPEYIEDEFTIDEEIKRMCRIFDENEKEIIFEEEEILSNSLNNESQDLS